MIANHCYQRYLLILHYPLTPGRPGSQYPERRAEHVFRGWRFIGALCLALPVGLHPGRMGGGVDLFELSYAGLGIDLRGTDVGMSQHGLGKADVGPAL